MNIRNFFRSGLSVGLRKKSPMMNAIIITRNGTMGVA
ncbi:Uncharacterised protein [Mycobacteroides abscessus subsp. abscessus]|nr:Uncharacterised protein [Mycobacteroides abscessus subsp. abscessus]SLK35163.1 Uncharacterised protein [Mycobacteroides abscessus subsp. massiliense]